MATHGRSSFGGGSLHEIETTEEFEVLPGSTDASTAARQMGIMLAR